MCDSRESVFNRIWAVNVSVKRFASDTTMVIADGLDAVDAGVLITLWANWNREVEDTNAKRAT
jgi:hypothetical protein